MRTRGDAAHEAAGKIYSLVAESLRETGEEPYEGAREHRAKLSIEGRIADAMGRSYGDALSLMVGEGRQELQHIRLGHYDPREDAHESDDPDAGLSRLDLLKRTCQETVEEIGGLLDHRCEFGEDDWCVTCGLDGRA